MADVGFVDAVQKQVRDAKEVGKRLLLDPEEGVAQKLTVLIGAGRGLGLQHASGGIEEAARTAGEVRHHVARLQANVRGHEVGERARRVVLASGTRALEFAQDRFVDEAEGVRLFRVAEVELVDEHHQLVELNAVLHVVVDVFEDRLHHALAAGAVRGQLKVLERREEVVVDEVEKFVAFERFRVADVGVRPVAPTEVFRNDRFVLVIHQLPNAFGVVVDLEEEHPRQLLDALRITVDAGILAHDVADALHEISNAHSSSMMFLFSDRSSGR